MPAEDVAFDELCLHQADADRAARLEHAGSRDALVFVTTSIDED